MEAKYEARKRELLEECTVAPQIFERVLPRLERFMEPFVANLVRKEQCKHASTFVQGLLSNLEHKNTESIAYRFGQQRMGLQWFVGKSDWDHGPLRDELVRQVGEQLGEEDGVIVFDPSGFPKSGRESVGVARQWCGRLGKVDNCQVAICMGYVSSKEHALVDTRLFLPKEWTKDKKRRQKAGVPKQVRFRTRHQLCLEMLAQHGGTLPHAWIAGDDEMGRLYWFRRRLNALDKQYLLAVPSNTQIRDLEIDPPAYSGHGRPPKRPWTRVDKWVGAVSKRIWTKVDVRDGSKGPLVVEVVKRCVVTRTDKRQEGHAEVLVIIRFRERDTKRVLQTDYYLSNATAETHVAEFARVAKAEHRIEECIQRAKSEAGLADHVEPVGERAERSPQLEGLAPSSNTLTHCHVVFGDGSPAGKNNGHRRLRCRRSAKASVPSCTVLTDAVFTPASCTNESSGSFATNSPAFIIGNSVIA